MQPGGETNYRQRALMQDGDNDVAKLASWITKRSYIRILKIRGNSMS